ncbi:MAG: hypothetical protein QOF77_1176 [Solirubrobacteraceae bacterium]|jgi:hypothetical protein|nr:hypothetical protein [Solirubrobacteraceae bacterium]
MADDPDPTSPAEHEGEGDVGIGSDVTSGHNPGSPTTDESSGEARDAVGGHAPMDDDPKPR